jgi:hypothetical protein
MVCAKTDALEDVILINEGQVTFVIWKGVLTRLIWLEYTE